MEKMAGVDHKEYISNNKTQLLHRRDKMITFAEK